MKESILDSKIGARIKQLRKARHMTQEQLAETLDITVKHISSVERGVARMSLEKMVDLCKALDTGMDYLVLGRTPLGGDVPLPESIIEVLRSGDENKRAPLMEYLFLYDRIIRKDS